VKLEVRCCCNPVKLYGRLEIPHALVAGSRSIKFPMYDLATGDYDSVEFEIAHFTADGKSRAEPALKFEGDQPFDEKLALLRRIRGFEEAEHV
jgi:hypothetical protein